MRISKRVAWVCVKFEVRMRPFLSFMLMTRCSAFFSGRLKTVLGRSSRSRSETTAKVVGEDSEKDKGTDSEEDKYDEDENEVPKKQPVSPSL